MNEIDELVDWISNPPINRGMVPYVLVLNLEEFTRTKEGIEFLKAFADRLEEYFSGRGCRLYRLSLASLVMTVADQEVLVSGVLSDTKLQLLRMIGRQLPDYFGAVDVNRITQIIDLRRDRQRALDLVQRLANQAAKVDQVSHMMDMLLLEHISRIESAYKQLGDARFADLFLRSQQIAIHEEGKPLHPVMSEFFASMAALRQHLLVGVDMRHNKNVFNQMTVTLDRIILKAIEGIKRPEQRASLNLNIESVFSSDFEIFEKRSLNSLRRFNFEFRISDIMQNFNEFLAARDLIQGRGGTVAIDGIIPSLVNVIDLAQLNPNMVKVFWQPALGPELLRRRAYFDRLKQSGIVLALARVDDEDGYTTGRDLGFGMFQGYHIDKLLSSPTPVPMAEFRGVGR